jgi:hypothetical protein
MTIDFKGFDDWVEIFSGGQQTDSNGTVHDGDAMIDRAVQTFDIDHHEPPAVVGHPKDNAPAYAWVNALKSGITDGVKRLYARFTDVVPEFEAAVKSGSYKKRSASFYPDGRLRHVGFLGAMPPAVKGLKNIAFGDDDGQCIAFEFTSTQPLQKERPMKFSEFLSAINIFKKMGGKDEEIDMIAPPAPASPDGKQFSEADVEAAKKAAAEETETRVRAEFAEKQKGETKKRRDEKVATWVEDKVAAGIIPPAIRDGGLVTFMQGLPDDLIQFAEGQEKQSGLDWFKGFLDTLGESPLFAEIATKDAAGKRQNEAEAEYKLGKEIGERANR